MNQTQRTELLTLLARESYFERSATLTLASGRSSNYYIDCKRTLYLPRGAYLAGELMLELVLAEGIEQIGGMAAGALPVTDALIAAAHNHGANLRGFFVRKEMKPHGLQQQIEGAFRRELARGADRRHDHHRRLESASRRRTQGRGRDRDQCVCAGRSRRRRGGGFRGRRT